MKLASVSLSMCSGSPWILEPTGDDGDECDVLCAVAAELVRRHEGGIGIVSMQEPLYLQ